MKDAYIVYVSRYNRALDYTSFNRDQESKGLRSTVVNKPPHCMVEGGLKHSLYWIKWNVEYGLEKPYHQEIRIRRKRTKTMNKAKEEAKRPYRYYRHKDSK